MRTFSVIFLVILTAALYLIFCAPMDISMQPRTDSQTTATIQETVHMPSLAIPGEPSPPIFDILKVEPSELPKTTRLLEPIRFIIAKGAGSATASKGSQVNVISKSNDQIEVSYLDGKQFVPYTKTTIQEDVIRLRKEISRKKAEDIANKAKEKYTESGIDEDKSTQSSVESKNLVAQHQTAPISGTLQMLISKGNESLARTEFEKYLRTAERLEMRGTVLRHLQSGHLLVKGSVGYPKTRGMKYYQTYLLFGLPEANRLADGDTFDVFAVYGDAIEAAEGSRIREYIYVDEGGRRPSRFPRNTGMYD